MNSLQELNDFGIQTVEVDDLRPATVIFDVDTRYVDLNTAVTYTSNTKTFTTKINVEEIRNYATANLRFRVAVITNGITPNSTINFGTLPSGITLTQVGEVYALSGFKTSTEWLSIIDFIWTLPTNYTSANLLFLKLEILYFDEATNRETVVDWVYYDDAYYYDAALVAAFNISAGQLKIVQTTSTMMSRALTSFINSRLLSSSANPMTLVSLFQSSGDVTNFANLTSAASLTSELSNRIRTTECRLTMAAQRAFTLGARTRRTPALLVSGAVISSTSTKTSRTPALLTVRAVQTLSSYLRYRSTPSTPVVRFNQSSQANATFSQRANLTTRMVQVANNSIANLLNLTLNVDTATEQTWFEFLLLTATGKALVYWGDGTTTSNTQAGVEGLYTHTYAATGTYAIAIEYTAQDAFGEISQDLINSSHQTAFLFGPRVKEINYLPKHTIWVQPRLGSSDTREHIIDTVPSRLQSRMQVFLFGNLDINPIRCTSLNDSNISQWDTSNLKLMNSMFRLASAFNQPIGSWNVSNVVDFDYMFDGASVFNQSIGSWTVSKWGDTYSIKDYNVDSPPLINEPQKQGRGLATFRNAAAFNQNINNWNVSKLTSFEEMFRGATAFNQPLNSWNTANVIDFEEMFRDATAFNQPLNSWNTANVIDMRFMFRSASAFNQPLNNWNTAKVTSMSNMFNGASVFDQDISSWDVVLISTKPTNFDTGTPVTWTTAEKPQWGTLGT